MTNSPPTTHRVTEFYQWYKGDILDLSPRFQRNPVWSHINKSYLIDTILNNYPVPEIFLQIETTSEGQTKYVVVDGQQRIRSILEYIDGEYAVLESESSKYGGKEFKELSDGLKKTFWDYQIVTRELNTSSEDEVTAVFKRMNKYVVPLNAQELRNATYRGHFITLVNALAEDDFWSDHKIVSPTDIKRMLDCEFISDLLISIMHGIQTKKTDIIDHYYQMYDDNFTDEEVMKKKVRGVMAKVDDILEDLRPTRWHRKNEFYSLFSAISQLMDEYYFPAERYPEMRKRLCEFAERLDKVTIAPQPKIVDEFIDTVTEHTNNKEPREKRTNIVREIIIPLLIAKDATRAFSEEERRIAWNNSPDKLCALCHEKIDWDNYHLDHITPHTKGGKTELSNSQLTHKKCNLEKSSK